jgi:uncharacterized protein YqjF (DUF2071 family)
MRMRWHDLLFMHWPLPAAALRQFVPASLDLDTYDGAAWLGVVPFRMTGVRPRLVPPVPLLSAFPELNVRTYVTAPGGAKPGVWFFSLDATNPLAVRAARIGFDLPYYDARISCRPGPTGEAIRYESTRTHRGAPPAEFAANYRPTGPAYAAAPGSLDYWLTERYCLYTADPRGRAWRCEIAHVPWSLRPAEANVRANTMADQLGLALPRTDPLLHFGGFQDAVAWLPERVGAS